MRNISKAIKLENVFLTFLWVLKYGCHKDIIFERIIIIVLKRENLVNNVKWQISSKNISM